MRLRESVRPPQRFDTEDFTTPGSQQSLRKPSSQARPSIVDFNPNLPPAAFPSLDRPRASEKRVNSADHYSRAQRAEEETQSAENNGQRRRSQNGNGGSEKETQQVEFEDISMDEIENHIASNGDLNPVYVKNMAIMANAVETPYADMEDSDPDELMADSPMAKIDTVILATRDSQWSDLSPRMQVEIFNNLLRLHNFLAVSHMLGLSIDEANGVQEYFELPNHQIQLENSELEKMRAKQVRALMRIDNSALRRSGVPHQLVFRKASRQCTRRLREGIETDYLLCQSGELLSARRFLHKRGIDRRHAGDWSNDMVALRSPENDSEPEIFEWKEDLTTTHEFPEAETVPAYTTPTPSKRPRVPLPMAQNFSRESFINATGRALIINPRELVQRKGHPPSFPPSWLDQYQRQVQRERFEQHKKEHNGSPQSRGLVCLKIGTEGAAKVRNSERTYLDQENMFQPQCGNWYRKELPESDKEKNISLEEYAMVDHPTFPKTHPVIAGGPPGKTSCPPITTTEPVFSHPEGPVRRTIGGNWSYSAVDHNPMAQTSSFFRTRQKLEAAKVEKQLKRAGQMHDWNAAMVSGQIGGPDTTASMLPHVPTPFLPGQTPAAMNWNSSHPQEGAVMDNAEETLTEAQFEALEKEFLNLDSDTQSEGLPDAPSGQDDTPGNPKPGNQSSDPPVQDNAGDPRQSLPTPTSGSRESGDEDADEADRYQRNWLHSLTHGWRER